MTRRWSIQEIARLTGCTSRTLRHYDAIGLLPPSAVAPNGYRQYDETALVRLQRILLLRELGLGLRTIADLLRDHADEPAALATHLTWLRQEQDRLSRQIASVERTIASRTEGTHLMAEDILDGFDHTRYRTEVEERWGANGYARSDAWWRGKTDRERAAFQADTARRDAAWAAAADSGMPPESDDALALAAEHVAWLRSMPGNPASDGGSELDYVRALGDMYAADPRFAAHYGGVKGAEYVRAALHRWADVAAPTV